MRVLVLGGIGEAWELAERLVDHGIDPVVGVAYLLMHGRFDVRPRQLVWMIAPFGLIWTVTGVIFGELLERFLQIGRKAADPGTPDPEPALVG